ncbi:MAG: M48 family metalloprotease [Deltaproteobacteria bacterium]|jgi:heat shock protein HtpX|nr:M48 family metalloprotease [Deltaproteobacteria bacterium]
MANQVKTLMLFALLAGAAMALGQLAGGRTGLIIAFAVAAAANAGAYWFSASLVLAQTRARVLGPHEAPELLQLVAHLAQNAGLPMPRVAVVDDPSPNAFATGRNPSHAVVAVTRGLMDAMTREELAGVLSHELAHVKHRDILVCSVAAAMASAVMFLASMARYAALFGRGRGRGGGVGGILPGLLLALLAPLAATLVQAAISRSREYLADEEGANIAQTPYGLADALEKLGRGAGRPVASAGPATASLFIVNPLSASGISGLFATHPPLEERIQRLRGLRI